MDCHDSVFGRGQLQWEIRAGPVLASIIRAEENVERGADFLPIDGGAEACVYRGNVNHAVGVHK